MVWFVKLETGSTTKGTGCRLSKTIIPILNDINLSASHPVGNFDETIFEFLPLRIFVNGERSAGVRASAP